MEIERKWFVSGWPEGLEPAHVYEMEQGYLALHPNTVRIRSETEHGGSTAYILCFKGAGKLVREEIETEIDAALFARLSALIGRKLIHKERRDYPIAGGLMLEVNEVDAGSPTTFFYAEIEFSDVAAARSWDSAGAGLSAYLSHEVTERSGVSMGAYWSRTRHGND